MRQHIRVTGDAMADQAWERYYFYSQWHDWSPLIQSVESTQDHLEVGHRGTVRGPCRLGIDFTVTAVDVSERSWTWRVVVPVMGNTLELHHTVTRDNDGCATELIIDGFAPLVLGYLPLARLALSRLVRAS